MMKPKIVEAKTPEERKMVFRFRYDTYVEEMGRYRSVANHEERTLIEDEDDTARLYMALDGDRVVGCMRHNWGGDSPFCDRHITQYSMSDFLERVPAKQCIVGERFMVSPDLRGTDLIFRLFKHYLNFVNDNRIQLIFGDCEPHLLNLYLGMGFRTFAARNVNSRETGYLIPLVMVPEDMEYMRHINSSIMGILKDFGDGAAVPDCIPELLANSGAVKSSTLLPQAEYSANIMQQIQLAQPTTHLFDGLNEEEQQLCQKKSNVIECRAGDHLIKKGNVTQNMFVVLSGVLEVRVDNRVVSVCESGDTVGEMAFLLESPRSADVFVAVDGTKVLSLSESNLKILSAEEPEIASKILLNLSKLLCRKLIRGNR